MPSERPRPTFRRSQSLVNWGTNAVHTFDRDAPTEHRWVSHSDPPTSAPATPFDGGGTGMMDTGQSSAIVEASTQYPFPAQPRGVRVSQMPVYPPPTHNRPHHHRSNSDDGDGHGHGHGHGHHHRSKPDDDDRHGHGHGHTTRAWRPSPSPQKAADPYTPAARSYSQQEEGGRRAHDHHHHHHHAPNGGILSSLIHLTALHRRNSQATSVPSTAAPSRAASSTDGDLPTYSSLGTLGMQRSGSNSSMRSNGETNGLDEDHPLLTGVKGPRDWFGDSERQIRDELREKGEGMSSEVARKLEKKAIQYHMSSVKARQTFMLRLAKALLTFGFPPHRLEPTVDAISTFLHLDASTTLYSKRIQIVFEDQATGTSLTKVIKAAPALNLGMLHETHQVYRAVMHDEVSVDDGTRKLSELLKAKDLYPLWVKVLLVWGSGIFICPAFGGSILDSLVAAVPGALIFLLQQFIAARNGNLKSISNVLAAILGSFCARGLSSTGYFCYEAIASASIVFILPAFPALCGALELLNENWDRAVASIGYSVLYVVVLGMGLSIGSSLFLDVDPNATAGDPVLQAMMNGTQTVDGTFTAMNATMPLFSGTFTFMNSSTIGDTELGALQQGNIICYRDPSWPWYRQSIGDYSWAWVVYIPIFSLFLSLLNGQPLFKKQTFLMVAIAVIGQAANQAANKWLLSQAYVVNVVGPFVLGLTSIVVSRLSHGKYTALVLMLPGVLVSVPGGIAAAGGVAMTETTSSDIATSALGIGGRMISVATGISLGLILSAAVGYFSNLHKKRTAIFAF